MPSDERKTYVTWKGTKCEYIGQAKIFGIIYYDIIVKGLRKTVPASQCQQEQTSQKEQK